MDRSAEQYANIAARYYKLGQYDKAFAACNKAIQVDPQCARAYHGRGLILTQWKKHKEALEDYQKACELASANAKLYADMGELFYCLKEYEKSRLTYENAIQFDTKYEAVYQSKAQCLVNGAINMHSRGLSHEANIAFKEVLLFNPEDTQAKNYLSDQQRRPIPKTSPYRNEPYSGTSHGFNNNGPSSYNNEWNLKTSVHPANCRCHECWEP